MNHRGAANFERQQWGEGVMGAEQKSEGKIEGLVNFFISWNLGIWWTWLIFAIAFCAYVCVRAYTLNDREIQCPLLVCYVLRSSLCRERSDLLAKKQGVYLYGCPAVSCPEAIASISFVYGRIHCLQSCVAYHCHS